MKLKKFVFGALPESDSDSGSLNKTDLLKTGRLLMIVVAGAAATAALDFIAQWLTGADLGPYTPFIMPVASAALEAARRFIASNLR